MCRLFAMSGGARPTRATFWLLEAPDSLATQSRREPDGTGLGVFDPDGSPRVEKRPIAAYEDRDFARVAREVASTTFIAHIRYASTGGLELRNTHPFEQRGRLFAHNGVVEGLRDLEHELGDHRSLVHGETDSERFFALVTRHADSNGGDVGAALTSAARWVARHLPLFALNVVLTTPRDVWALRYPETHELFVLDRKPGGPRGGRHLDHASAAGHVRVRSGDLRDRPAVVVASERMDEDPAWRPLESGELIHVDRELRTTSRVAVAGPPAHPLGLGDLDPHAAASQHPTPPAGGREA